jgi:hypothetical protein
MRMNPCIAESESSSEYQPRAGFAQQSVVSRLPYHWIKEQVALVHKLGAKGMPASSAPPIDCSLLRRSVYPPDPVRSEGPLDPGRCSRDRLQGPGEHDLVGCPPDRGEVTTTGCRSPGTPRSPHGQRLVRASPSRPFFQSAKGPDLHIGELEIDNRVRQPGLVLRRSPELTRFGMGCLRLLVVRRDGKVNR